MNQTEILLTREQLATRWNCSVRKLDRMRTLGLLEWIDITGGLGHRPTVRFPISMIHEFENRNLMSTNTHQTV